MTSEREQLRADRYAAARTLWTGNFWQSEREIKSVEIINRESLRILELEQQYASAQDALSELISSTEAEITKLEELSQNATNSITKLEKELEIFKKTQSKQKAMTENELQKDQNTYQTASKLLDERLKQAQIELESVKETIESFEPRPFLKNPQAQELYLQFKALMTAQEKEIRALLRTATKSEI